MSESTATYQKDHHDSKADAPQRKHVKDLSIDDSKVDDQKEHSFVDSPVPSGSPKRSHMPEKALSKKHESSSKSKEESVYDPNFFAVNELSDQQTSRDYLREFLENTFPNNSAFHDDRGIGLIFTATSLLVGTFMFSMMCTFFINPSNWRFWFGLSRFALFHLCDFFLTARNQPDLVTYKSFFLFNPMMQSMRMFFLAEYWVWRVLAPDYVNGKLGTMLAIVAAIGCIAGQVLRIMAMWQLKEGFTYCLAQKKRENHELKTNGLYQFVRHPSYTGAMLLFTCTGLVLSAPLSLLFIAWTRRGVMQDRCDKEEAYLGEMFGKEYDAYKKQVPWRLIPQVY